MHFWVVKVVIPKPMELAFIRKYFIRHDCVLCVSMFMGCNFPSFHGLESIHKFSIPMKIVLCNVHEGSCVVRVSSCCCLYWCVWGGGALFA